MRKRILFSIFLIIFCSGIEAQTTKVLFIGNSYTGVNDLPGLVRDLALSNGDSMIVDSYSPGGYTFEGHFMDANTEAKIYSQQWDYVVLQEQSQRPSFSPAQVAMEVYPYAILLDSMIHDNNPCSETVFYMTWGRKNGDASNCGFYPPVCTYEGMQARLRESYIEMALQNGATVSPVGAAWRYLRSLNPAYDLYQVDESHPSIHGSYLAACTFYAAIFHKSPVGSSFLAGIPQLEATEIQNAVQAVVMDSISYWYQYGNIPIAAFSYTANGNGFQFVNHSMHTTTYSWDFGDGNASTSESPFYTYAQAGTYTVTLTATNGCKTDIITYQVTTGVSSLVEISDNCHFAFNESGNEIQFNCNTSIKEVQLYDLQGKLMNGKILQNTNGQLTFQCDKLAKGIYVVQVTGEKFRWSEKINVVQ